MTISINDRLAAAVPELGGTLRVSDLESDVHIYRDTLGVPHARAASTHDAFFAQGFVHAQDRLWQMCYDRRRAEGRLAEWLGPRALTLDIYCRRLGLVPAARSDYEAFDDETRDVLDAYTAGVNAFIATTSALPVELDLLGAEPEPWRPWDCGAVMNIRHVLMSNADRKLWRARLLRTIGPEAVVSVGSSHGRDDTLIIPVDARAVWNADAADLEPSALAVAGIVDGSNNWAVHGSRTASGLPLVAGDPHRTLEVPNVYYQNHIACPSFDAIGFSMAGVPGMFHFGHNAGVAWSVTHAMADGQDLYVERFADGTYEFRGEWLPVKRHSERMVVHDAPDVEIDVTRTHHGPVLYGDPRTGSAITLRWTAVDRPNTTLRAILPMLRARTVDELEECMRWWVDPCNNFVMADTLGTIAYLHRGRVPVRPRANGWTPVPGWTGEHEWSEDVAFERLPRLRDPEAGFIATANNRVQAGNDPYLGMDYGPSYRARRVIERLRALDHATPEDMALVHADRVAVASFVFLDTVSAIVPWNGTMDPDSAGATVYAVLREKVAEILCERDPVRDVAANHFSEEPLPVPTQSRIRAALPRLIEREDGTILNGAGWSDLLAEASERAVAWLEDTLGNDRSKWQWSRLHTTGAAHPLSTAYPELNPVRVATGGDGETVQATGWQVPFGVQHTSVARYVFDLGDWDRSGWVVPLGSSGHPASPHYDDQAQTWADVGLYPMTYSWPAVQAQAETRQTLEPSR